MPFIADQGKVVLFLTASWIHLCALQRETFQGVEGVKVTTVSKQFALEHHIFGI